MYSLRIKMFQFINRTDIIIQFSGLEMTRIFLTLLVLILQLNLSIAQAQVNINTDPIKATNVKSALPANWNKNPRFMEIFVRSYKDSDGDGIGDIRGIISKLDYLKELGVNGIWLMPIHPSEDNDHGYAVADYRAVAPDYGTIADMELLIKEAHKREIGIILDFVINHSASTHPFFENAASSKTSPYRDYYIFKESRPSWGKNSNSWRMKSGKIGFYYGAFDTSMPDWNLRNDKVRDYLKDSMRFWLEKGIDGFRFDAVTMLLEDGPDKTYRNPGNQKIIEEFRDAIHQYDNRFMVCEVSEMPQEYTDACDHTFAFGAQQMIINSVKSGRIEKSLIDWLNSPLRDAMPLTLQSHDFYVGNRLFDQFGKDNLDKYKAAAAIALLSVPVSFTYYGEEIGMANLGELNDVGMRAPMSWTNEKINAGFSKIKPYRDLAKNYAQFNVADELSDENSLLKYYQFLFLAKTIVPELNDGEFRLLSKTGDEIYAFERFAGGFSTFVIINLSNSDKKFALETKRSGYFNLMDSRIMDNVPTLRPSDGKIELNLKPNEVKIMVGE